MTIISRVGGKFLLKEKILKEFPPPDTYKIYVEPFVGAGHIFFSAPMVEVNVLNDLDPIIPQLFKDVKKLKEEEIEKIDLTPTKKLFDYYKQSHFKTALERIQQFLFLNKNSYAGRMLSYTPIRYYSKTNENIQNRIRETKQFFKKHKIIIENKDYSVILDKYDSSNTFFYLDPPYFETAKNVSYSSVYLDPVALAERLKHIKGKFLLSYNDHPEIRRLFKGYKIQKITTRYGVQGGSIIGKELIIKNY